MRKRIGLLAAAGALALVGATAPTAAADGHGQGYYGVWASNVNVREVYPDACWDHPSTTNCPSVLGQVSAPTEVFVRCQFPGQTIGGNPYWVVVEVPGWTHYGVMPSYYIDNASNWIDGVPTDCVWAGG
ncbi:hypothetical protein [Streptomyces sp. GESEQ-35]|uniref:hypothetical protein n=1 Tax=Streptomyces sp. GESEQ-35 TaxID=2812657 RepID=UPI001B322869|nr:hypothetical protein [Streptomyces sp. GESEQ-35]